MPSHPETQKTKLESSPPEHLRIDGIRIVYGSGTDHQLEAVEKFDLSVRRGEFVVMIGPSGCGKSSVLHSVGGMQRPAVGQISVNSTMVDGPDPHRVAFVFQEYSLFPWLSIVDNVGLGLRYAGRSKRERRLAAVDAIRAVGLEGFEESFPSELSGGMQQRAAIARALVMKPECLLLDEPFGAVDEMTRRRLGVELATNLRKQNQTVMMVTHSLEEAIYWGDRVVVMSQRPGRIVETIAVGEPWPRSWDFVSSPLANKLRADLLDLLHSEKAI